MSKSEKTMSVEQDFDEWRETNDSTILLGKMTWITEHMQAAYHAATERAVGKCKEIRLLYLNHMEAANERGERPHACLLQVQADAIHVCIAAIQGEDDDNA